MAPTPEELLAHAKWLRRLAVALVGSGGGAEDLVQDTWLAALRHPPRRPGPLRPWLAQVLRNLVRMRHRAGNVRRDHRDEVEWLQAERAAPPSPEALLDRFEMERRLGRLVAELDEPYRTAVLLRYSEGLSAADIARHQGIPAATVRWRVKTGLDRLRAALDAENQGDRRAWRLALLPLAARASTGSRAATALKGIWLMTRIQKLGAGLAFVLALLLGLGGVVWLRGGARRDDGKPPPAPAAAVAPAPARPPVPRASGAPPQRLLAARVEADPGLVHGAFAGRVLNFSTGRGVPGAQVTFAADGGSHTVAGDAQGGFAFEPPEAGRYALAVVAAPGYLPFAPEWGTSPIQLTARPGLRIADLVIFLTPAIDYLGVVVDPDGRPVAGAEVRLLDAAAGEQALVPIADRFVADAKGEVVFHARDGAILEARHAGFGPGRARLDGAATVSHRLEIALTRLGPASAALGGLRITGRVIDAAGAPVRGAFVRAEHVADGDRVVHPDAQARTSDDGRFEAVGLDPGLHHVVAGCPGCTPAAVDAEAGAEVTLKLARGGMIAGHAIGTDRQPVASFTVIVTRRRSALIEETVAQATVVDGEGHFEIAGLAAGDYRVRAAGDGHAPAPPVDAHVEPGEDPSDVLLTLPAGGTVRGRVVERGTGKPLELARVSVESNLDAGSSAVPLIATTVTDADGQFTLAGLEPGLRSVTAAAYQHDLQSRSGIAIADGASIGSLVFELAPTKTGEQPKTELFGIGCVLQATNDFLTIARVLPGGGGAAVGLRPGDAVLRVDGIPVAELGMDAAIERIRGPEGSVVALTVRRAADGSIGEIATPRLRFTY